MEKETLDRRSGLETEIEAIRVIYSLLDSLTLEARYRVLDYVKSLLRESNP